MPDPYSILRKFYAVQALIWITRDVATLSAISLRGKWVTVTYAEHSEGRLEQAKQDLEYFMTIG